MAATENKTKPTEASPEDFLASLDHPVRKADAERLLEIFADVTGMTPKLWGPSIIGYGQYHYKYESGREGDFMMTGFSPRKQNLSIYILPGYSDFSEILGRLGKHKHGKSCLYINKLSDVDIDVLKELIAAGLEDLKRKYPDWQTS